MLNDGTIRAFQECREGLLDRWDYTRDVYLDREGSASVRGGLDEWRRVRRCLTEAIPVWIRCDCCARMEVHLQGKCGRRDCLICCNRYSRKKARELRSLMGYCDWAGTYTVTLPSEMSEEVRPEDATKLLRKVCKALERVFAPLLPGGFACLHWTGDSNPGRPHVHVHVIWSELALLWGGAATMPGPTISDQMREDIKHAVGKALKVPKELRNGKYLHRIGNGKIQHCVNYALRPQGCGSDIARSRFTMPYVRTLRGFGGFRTGTRKKWRKVYPEYTESETEARRDRVKRFCRCGSSDHTPVT